MSEVRALVFSIIEKNEKAAFSLPIQAVIQDAAVNHNVSETLVRVALDDLVAFGLVEVSPNGTTLTTLSKRLTQ